VYKDRSVYPTADIKRVIENLAHQVFYSFVTAEVFRVVAQEVAKTLLLSSVCVPACLFVGV
jgi:hypothetical protein